MVVSASAPRKNPNPTATFRPSDPPPIPSRRPLTPSEKDNAAVSRRHKTKEIASRYLSSSSSSSTSTSYSSNTTTSSSSRRFHSPPNRSQSANRPRPDPAEVSSAARALCTTTRSLSVSFQGESFFYRTSKAKSPSPSPSPSSSRKPTPDRRRPATPARNSPSDFHQRWPAARTRPPGPLSNSAEKDEFVSAVQMLRQSSDRDAVSGTPEPNAPRQVPIVGGLARFRHLSEPLTPVNSARRTLVDSPALISRAAVSPSRPGTPSRVVGGTGTSRAVGGSPARARCGGALAGFSPGSVAANAPSILSFAAEVRRSRKGEGRIEEAHFLRLLHNKHLQWRCVNARRSCVMMVQRMVVEVRFGLFVTFALVLLFLCGLGRCSGWVF